MTDDRPFYADDASSTQTWVEEADRSQGWAVEARAAARRRQRRRIVYGWLIFLALLAVCAGLVAFVAYTIAQATDLSQR